MFAPHRKGKIERGRKKSSYFKRIWNLSQSEDEEIEFIFKKKEEKKTADLTIKIAQFFSLLRNFLELQKGLLFRKWKSKNGEKLIC